MTTKKKVCPICESKRTKVLSDGTILCQSKKCLSVTIGNSVCDNCDKFVPNSQITLLETGLKVCNECAHYYEDGKGFEEMLEDEDD
jgi:hypothetical protein